MKTKYVEILLDEVIKTQIHKEIISYFNVLIKSIEKFKNEGYSDTDILWRIIRVYSDLGGDSFSIKKKNKLYKLMKRFDSLLIKE